MALAHVYYLKDAHELVDAGIDGFMHPVRDAVMDDALIARMKAQNVFLAANIGGSHRATLTELPDIERWRACRKPCRPTSSPPTVRRCGAAMRRPSPPLAPPTSGWRRAWRG